MPPGVVFFPGASGAGVFWAPVADRMPSDWDARLLSWPGAGSERHSPAVAGYDDLVALAAASVVATWLRSRWAEWSRLAWP